MLNKKGVIKQTDKMKMAFSAKFVDMV